MDGPAPLTALRRIIPDVRNGCRWPWRVKQSMMELVTAEARVPASSERLQRTERALDKKP
jgi:hypothetical protein